MPTKMNVGSTAEIREVIPQECRDEVLRSCMESIVEGAYEHGYAIDGGHVGNLCNDLALVVAGASVILSMNAEPEDYYFDYPHVEHFDEPTEEETGNFAFRIVNETMLACHWYFSYGKVDTGGIARLRDEALMQYARFSLALRGNQQREILMLAFQKVLMRLGLTMTNISYDF